MKLGIGIPCLDNVNHSFFLWTSHLIGKWARKRELALLYPNRMAIDRAREYCAKSAQQQGCDYLLFIDDDTLVPEQTPEVLIDVLLRAENIISATGVCYQRSWPYLPMIYKFPKDKDKVDSGYDPRSNQLIPPFPDKPFRIDCNGLGIAMLKVSLLEGIKKPWFGRSDKYGTEDFYFYDKAAEAGLEAWCDPSLGATHLGDRVEVTPQNVEGLRMKAFSLYEGNSSEPQRTIHSSGDSVLQRNSNGRSDCGVGDGSVQHSNVREPVPV